MNVGFIGLGIMGGSMAMNIIKEGHKLVVHDIQIDSATSHLEAGARWATTPEEVAEQSEIIVTSLPGPLEVEAVAFGEAGLKEGLSKGKIYMDLSTSSPRLIREIHEVFAKQGVHVLDAPVSGGPEGARTRKLAVWVGGSKEVFEQARPVLDAIGDKP